jgi:DHA2 family multidrug resistance protein
MIPLSQSLLLSSYPKSRAGAALGIWSMTSLVAPVVGPPVALGLSGLAPERIPAASSLMNFARITAGSFGTSIVTTLGDRRATLHHAQLVDHLSRGAGAPAHALERLHAGGFSAGQSYGILNRIVDAQAFMLSANDIFYASGLVFVALIAVIWLARPARGSAASHAGAGAHS